jgi:hypothetical protein
MQNKYFDTYGTICTSYTNKPGASMAITKRCHCCGKSKVVLRRRFDDAEKMTDFAINESHFMNIESIKMFLRYKPKVLRYVWELSERHGLYLTRFNFLNSLKNEKPYLCVFLRNMSLDRFLAICKVLERYGILIQVEKDSFVSVVRGPY